MPTLSVHNQVLRRDESPSQKKLGHDGEAVETAAPPNKIRRHSEVTSSAVVTSVQHPARHSEEVSSSAVTSVQHQVSRHEQRRLRPSFGICFDVDGVIAHGTHAIPAAPKAFKRLVDENGQFKVPVVFVTNSLNRRSDRANQLTQMLGVPVSTEQVIQAPGPLEIFTKLHDKFCLVVGQGKVLEIASDLGFRHMCTIEDVVKAYPLLDVVDHDNRRRNEMIRRQDDPDFKRVEAIILMGEPRRWESVLQILVDLLRSDGKLSQLGHSSSRTNIPIIACNMDLEFKDRATTPRFGHGAFLVCLEALYQKLTGKELQYTALVGKPSEITFRFAEHVLTQQSQKLEFCEPIKNMYLIGDAPATDIAGSNLYQKYVHRLAERREACAGTSVHDSKEDQRIELVDPELPGSRNVPCTAKFHPQSVTSVVPILVCTGIYKPDKENSLEKVEVNSTEEGLLFHHGHRDFFSNNEDLQKPEITCNDVSDAVDAILEREGWSVV